MIYTRENNIWMRLDEHMLLALDIGVWNNLLLMKFQYISPKLIETLRNSRYVTENGTTEVHIADDDDEIGFYIVDDGLRIVLPLSDKNYFQVCIDESAAYAYQRQIINALSECTKFVQQNMKEQSNVQLQTYVF